MSDKVWLPSGVVTIPVGTLKTNDTIVINVQSYWYGKDTSVTWWWRIASARDSRAYKSLDNQEFIPWT